MNSSDPEGWEDLLRRGLRDHEKTRIAAPHPSVRYERREEIGSGSAGIVYRAWDRELNRSVALKVLRGEAASERRTLARFRREAETMARLAHPNLVAVHDFVEEVAGLPFIVMDLVEGSSLDRWMKEDPPLREVVEILEKAARGVTHAHEHGIVHRDLKPANILLSPTREPKVTDFGIARLVESKTRLTQSGSTLGSPSYMAPEQIRTDSKETTPAADVYALGVVLYEALTGRLPHEAPTPGELYAEILMRDPIPPRRRKSGVPVDLERICLKAMDKVTSKRYAMAGEFADDLGRYLKGEPVLARPTAPIVRLWKRRWKVLVPAAAITLLLLAAAAVLVGEEIVRSGRVRRAIADAERWEKSGNVEKAREAYRSALALDPDHPTARAGFRRTDARWSTSRRDLETRAERAKRQREALEILRDALPALDGAWEYLYDKRADYRELLRRVATAEGRIDEAIRRDPESALATYHRGRAWELRGELTRARRCWERAAKLDPRFAPAHFLLGKLLLTRTYLYSLSRSQTERNARTPETERLARSAAGRLETAMRNGLKDELYVEVARAMIAFARQEFDQVRKIASAGIERFGDRRGVEELHWLRGVVTGDLSAYDRALRLRPQYPLALFSRGSLHMATGRIDPALSDFDRAIELQPTFLWAYLHRARVREARKDLEGAIADYDAAVRLDPDDPKNYNDRGNARLAKGDPDGAVRDFNEAIRRNDGDGRFFHNRGVAFLRKKIWSRAVADFDVALRLDRGNVVRNLLTYLARGTAWDEQGMPDRALADYEAALKIAPARWPHRAAVEERARQLRRPR